MSDNDGKKTLGVRGGARSGSVKQSFSHGRTKNVVVETKRKRVVVPKPGAGGGAGGGKGGQVGGSGGKRPAGISDAEMERRLKALQAAKAREVEEAAKREAEMITTEAKKKTEEYVARRTALAEQKIAQAEADAMDEVRGSAVDMALAAATMIIGDKVKGDTATELFKKSLDEVKTRMN